MEEARHLRGGALQEHQHQHRHRLRRSVITHGGSGVGAPRDCLLLGPPDPGLPQEAKSVGAVLFVIIIIIVPDESSRQ